MFFINDAGAEVHSELTHDYSAAAEALIDEGADWGDVADKFTERFKASISDLHDSEEDVGAVMQYFKNGELVAYFDYENFWGTVL